MTFVFEGVVGASISLAIVYFLLSIYVSIRLYFVYHGYIDESIFRKSHGSSPVPRSTLNTKVLFVMTCLLLCLLRFMCFASMAIFDLSAIHYSVTTSGTGGSASGSFDDTITGTEEFFEKAFLVLFDFPDFCFVSAYLLLIVVWAEAYLQVSALIRSCHSL